MQEYQVVKVLGRKIELSEVMERTGMAASIGW